jgi:hypothetical protein
VDGIEDCGMRPPRLPEGKLKEAGRAVGGRGDGAIRAHASPPARVNRLFLRRSTTTLAVRCCRPSASRSAVRAQSVGGTAGQLSKHRRGEVTTEDETGTVHRDHHPPRAYEPRWPVEAEGGVIFRIQGMNFLATVGPPRGAGAVGKKRKALARHLLDLENEAPLKPSDLRAKAIVCTFRRIRSAVPTASGQSFRSIRSPEDRCRVGIGF